MHTASGLAVRILSRSGRAAVTHAHVLLVVGAEGIELSDPLAAVVTLTRACPASMSGWEAS
jgi:hypothetical protein